MEGTLFLLFYWSGPIGIGFFLVCLGMMLYLLTKASEIEFRVKKAKEEWKRSQQ